MSNVLLLYEIEERAHRVKTKKSLHQFERWVIQILEAYHDAAIERVARIHLFRLKSEFSMA